MKTHIKKLVIGYFEFDASSNKYLAYIDNSLIDLINSRKYKYFGIFSKISLNEAIEVNEEYYSQIWDHVSFMIENETSVDTILLFFPLGVYNVAEFAKGLSIAHLISRDIFEISQLTINKFTKFELIFEENLIYFNVIKNKTQIVFREEGLNYLFPN